MLPNLKFADALQAYCTEAINLKILTTGSAKSYSSYLNALERANGGHTMDWIKDNVANSKNLVDFIAYAKQTFATFIATNPGAIPANQQSKIKSAFLSFSLYIFSYFNGEADQLWSVVLNDLELAKLVASTALFATPTVVNDVISGKLGRKENLGKGNPHASWDRMSSIRDIPNKRLTINGLYRDDNTRANHAIKRALLHSLGWERKAEIGYFHGFEACHIYDMVKDPRFYTSIMNLALVPAALGALTDHNSYVQTVLKYRVFDLFGFTAGGSAPTVPKDYHKISWR